MVACAPTLQSHPTGGPRHAHAIHTPHTRSLARLRDAPCSLALLALRLGRVTNVVIQVLDARLLECLRLLRRDEALCAARGNV